MRIRLIPDILGNNLALEFRCVPYDVARLMEIYRVSGRPQRDQAIKQYGG